MSSADRIGRGLFSSGVDEWNTPASIMAPIVSRYGPFDLDPCCLPTSAKAPNFYTPADDGLLLPWTGRVYMNPPYGRTIGRWVRKARDEAAKGSAVVVCLVPARTDTAWWHDNVMSHASEVLLVRGRLHFDGGHERTAHNAPFPSAVILFDGGGPPLLGALEQADQATNGASRATV